MVNINHSNYRPSDFLTVTVLVSISKGQPPSAYWNTSTFS